MAQRCGVTAYVGGAGMSWLDKLVVKYRADKALADLFGVILYSDAQPHVKKVLRD